MQRETPNIVASIPNSYQWSLKGAGGDSYHIQAAWPLAWDFSTRRDQPVPIFYVLDGNAYYFSTVETVRRNAIISGGTDAVVVGIGYPPSKFPYDARRNYDLTPPSPHYAPPADADGKNYSVEHGGATHFIEFLVKTVRGSLFSGIISPEAASIEALVGHSYGGLCTLHALFTKLTPFDAFVAISPSIWWNEKFILSEQEQFLRNDAASALEPSQRKPKLFLSYGSYEQEPRRLDKWTEEEYNKNRALAHKRALGANAERMYQALRESGRFEKIAIKIYQEEDHLSVAMCGISWALSSIVDPDRFG